MAEIYITENGDIKMPKTAAERHGNREVTGDEIMAEKP